MKTITCPECKSNSVIPTYAPTKSNKPLKSSRCGWQCYDCGYEFDAETPEEKLKRPSPFRLTTKFSMDHEALKRLERSLKIAVSSVWGVVADDIGDQDKAAYLERVPKTANENPFYSLDSFDRNDEEE